MSHVKKTQRAIRPSETVEGQLQEYNIGAKLRELRLRRKLGLVQLAAHTGLSAALLSKLERGRLIPTLPTLQRIAMVYGVELAHFFGSRRPAPALSVARRVDRRRFPEAPGLRQPSYYFESLTFDAPNPASEAWVAHFERPTRPAPHSHDHFETLYVMSGTLMLTVDEQNVELSAGDAVYFDASTPHSYRRESAGECSALVFTVRKEAGR